MKTCVTALAAPCARVMSSVLPPDQAEGAGNAGSWPPPWPACRKKAGGSHHRFSRDIPAFPARWFSRLLRDLPGVRLGSHRRPRDHRPTTWRQHRGARTTRLRVRKLPFVRAGRPTLRHPAATASRTQRSVTIAKRPSRGARDGDNQARILKNSNRFIFLRMKTGSNQPSKHRMARASSVEAWGVVRPQPAPIGEADGGLAPAGVVHRGSASTWPKGPQPPLYTPPTTDTGTRLCWNRPIPMSGGTPDHCHRTAELRPERLQAR